MSRNVAYCRMSTVDQTPEKQIREIEAAGFKIEHSRVIAENVSGGVQAAQRLGFSRLLDRLPRHARLHEIGPPRPLCGRHSQHSRYACRARSPRRLFGLGGIDLTSAAGRMTMGVLAAVAGFETDLLKERTAAGIECARAEGKQPGRASRLTDEQRREIKARLAAGATVYSLAKELGVDRRLIQRARNAA